ncbi:P-loop containing nucleoside triphosphate hydrolase protein, partial [Boletus coccyginus]
LLDELFRTKHKVLLFSQFTTVLDIIETWATELKGWRICRIDGSTSPLERREKTNPFQGNSANAPILFLLSTRAGGLGITLTAADTVIFYDQDWNPQMDIQAQDRAHRIGQAKAVLVFRLVTAHTIETRIMQRATEKRQLEALVIAKG